MPRQAKKDERSSDSRPPDVPSEKGPLPDVWDRSACNIMHDYGDTKVAQVASVDQMEADRDSMLRSTV